MPRHVLFLRLAYQAGMCLLALVAVTLTAIDLTTEAAEWEVTADRTIYWIFVLDYVIRFSISRSKWLFVKEHPFGQADGSYHPSNFLDALQVRGSLNEWQQMAFLKSLRHRKSLRLTDEIHLPKCQAHSWLLWLPYQMC